VLEGLDDAVVDSALCGVTCAACKHYAVGFPPGHHVHVTGKRHQGLTHVLSGRKVRNELTKSSKGLLGQAGGGGAQKPQNVVMAQHARGRGGGERGGRRRRRSRGGDGGWRTSR
jgi:hypothetical protein